MNNPSKTAAAVCAERTADIEILTNHLKELIQGDNAAEDWGKAGSLGHVRDLLAQAVSFYGGLGTEDIEAVLAEIKGK